MPELVRFRNKVSLSGIGMIFYWTEMMNARMPMPICFSNLTFALLKSNLDASSNNTHIHKTGKNINLSLSQKNFNKNKNRFSSLPCILQGTMKYIGQKTMSRYCFFNKNPSSNTRYENSILGEDTMKISA
jgi:hypothetical protein